MLHVGVLHDLEAFAEFAHDASVLFIDEDDMAGLARAPSTHRRATGGGSLATHVILGIVRRRHLLALLLRVGGTRATRALQEGGALCQDGLECIEIFLAALVRSLADAWELDPGEGAAVWSEIPAGDEVAARRLMIDLRRCGDGEIQLRWEVKVQVEVLFWRRALRVGGR